MQDRTSVVIIDDDELIAAAIAALCEKLPGIVVIGQASDGVKGLQLIEDVVPQLALVDLVMPQLSGFELVVRARRKQLPTSIVILSGNPDEEWCIRAMHAGAAGYLLKSSPFQELQLAIQSVAGGSKYVCSAMTQALVQQPRETGDCTRLTSRQREILQLIVEGKSNKEIAAGLDLGIKTIEKHRAQIMLRLEAHSAAQLVFKAINNRFVLVP